MRSFALLTAALALTAASCNRAAPMPANQADYFPLAVGHEWYMDAVKESAAGQQWRGTAHREIEKTVERDGHTWFLTRISIEFPPTAKSEYTKLVRKDLAGFHSLKEEDPPGSEQNEIPFPMTTGHHWERTDGSDKTQDEVLGAETLEIGGLVFTDCCHIRSRSPNGMVQEYWEAPKVGNVKSVISLPSGTRVTMTLHEFKPGPE
ncbi:MAG TPA: hypothetical protein VGO11_25730 [Chthoniobacteraceae bacterium]|jgi:hypothetical protein|nr:hypothetical protein [Chthoniobacteraceae bacterium]